MAYYGRRVTAGDVDMGQVASGWQRGQTYGVLTENAWVYAVGSWGGKAPGSSNVTWRGGLWSTSGGNPSTRLGYTAALTVSNEMGHGGTGQNQEALLTAPVRLNAGYNFAIGFAVTGGTYNHGMSQAANNPSGVYNNYFHYRSGTGGTPTNPFSASSSTHEGAMDAYVVYEANVAPTVTTTGMAPSGLITTASPVFTGRFADANADRGDKMQQFQIHVERSADGVDFWNSTQSASSTEQSANVWSANYAGSTLAPGTAYRWRYRVSDQFGAWSAWSSFVTFTVNGGGAVELTTGHVPSGKQETSTPATFTGRWEHVSGLSTNAVEIRIKQGSTVVRTSATKAKTVTNGGTISLTWAETGFAALSWGTSYTYEIRGRDTGNLWSPWSNGRAFSINAYPTIPALVSPKGNIAITSRPLLIATASDPDDTVATGLNVAARIKNSAGTVLFTRNMTYSATRNRWEYQTTSTDLATFAQYKWDARSGDGTLVSAYSSEASFIYGEGPVITPTGPVGTITTNTPTISYTQSSTQSTKRVQVWLYDTVALEPLEVVWDSGTVASAAAAGVTVNTVVPSGNLHNGNTYVPFITSTNNLALVGTEWGEPFLLQFPVLPAPTGLAVSPLSVGNDVQPSAVMVTWDTPGYSTEEWVEALVLRRPEGADLMDAEILARLSSPELSLFVDYYPASAVSHTYSVLFVIMQGTDATETEIAEQQGSVILEHVVISSAVDGQLHVGLRYGKPIRTAHNRDSQRYYPWGQSKAHTLQGLIHEHTITASFELQNDRYSSGMDDLAMLRAIDDAGHTVCWRDQWGDKIFGDMTFSETKGERGQVAEVAIVITQNDHREGN